MSLQKNRWLRIILALGLLLGAGAWTLRATCSDGCPSSCPMHEAPLKDCTIIYDAYGGMKSATCRYTDGCSYTNAGGASGGGKPGIEQKIP